MINKTLSLKRINYRKKTEILTIKLKRNGKDNYNESSKDVGRAETADRQKQTKKLHSALEAERRKAVSRIREGI